MALTTAGETVHFIVQYEETLGPSALAVANAVLSTCEADLQTMSLYMPYRLDGDPFTSPKIAIHLINDPAKGPALGAAQNFGFSLGSQSLILINPFSSPTLTITDDYAGFVFVAEMAEILMSFYGWDAGSSQGEALSRVMAEQLHPASTKDFVSAWLNLQGRPRPDWISQNEPEIVVGGVTPRGDLDPVAYGCGIIFIYFLHSQLGFSFYQICTAGGVTLADRYRALTGATDDPATRVGDLLDSHFGTGKFNLGINNPFPLYEGTDRKVFLAFGKSTSAFAIPLPGSGTAHVQPFFTCPAGDYPFTEIGSTVTQTITATTLGIGYPVFTWKINGKAIYSSNQLGTFVSSSVNVPNPQNPDVPVPETQVFTFDYHIDSISPGPGGSSSLTFTSRSFGGDYQVEIHVDADEWAVHGGAVSAETGLTIHTRSIIYGGTYVADQERCQHAFVKIFDGRLRAALHSLPPVYTPPEPPAPDSLARVLEAVDHIRHEIAATDHATASKIARYAAMLSGVPAHVFLKSQHGGGRKE